MRTDYQKRKFSRRMHLASALLGISTFTGLVATNPVAAEQTPGFFTDPATGIVYRQVTRTIEKPVVETKMQQRQQTVYKPKTVTETRPATRRMYIPVTENRWVPKVENRWNPFVAPRVAYHHVPETRWQVKDEVISQTSTQVHWEPETQTISVPHQEMRMERQQMVDFEPVGRVAPNASPQTTNPAASAAPRTNIPPEIAARLRPLASNTPVQTNGADRSSASNQIPTQIASRVNQRTSLQTGLRATELVPSSSPGYVAPTDTSGIAGLPSMRIWR